MHHYLEAVTGTPWTLVVVFAVAGLDAVLPFMPSETTVVAVAVGAAAIGHPNLLALIVVAASGAFTGDQIGYLLGRRADGSVAARLDRHHRSRAARNWARQLMTSRGGLVIVVARYMPGGRSVTAFTAGLVGYPRARFAWYTGLAVLLWSAQAALLGYWGGVVFGDHPLLGFAVASTAAVLVTIVATAVHRAGSRRFAGDQGATGGRPGHVTTR